MSDAPAGERLGEMISHTKGRRRHYSDAGLGDRWRRIELRQWPWGGLCGGREGGGSVRPRAEVRSLSLAAR
jgi:hypothetical protein